MSINYHEIMMVGFSKYVELLIELRKLSSGQGVQLPKIVNLSYPSDEEFLILMEAAKELATSSDGQKLGGKLNESKSCEETSKESVEKES